MADLSGRLSLVATPFWYCSFPPAKNATGCTVDKRRTLQLLSGLILMQKKKSKLRSLDCSRTPADE